MAAEKGVSDPKDKDSKENKEKAKALELAETIARQHGGRLSVRSQDGLGNAFLLEQVLRKLMKQADSRAITLAACMSVSFRL